MNNYQEIIDCLSDCVPACEICGNTCLNEDDVKSMIRCIRLTHECAEICSLGVQLLSNESELAEIYIGICADSCTKCADECEKHDLEHCKKCAEVCRKCAEKCKEFLDNRRQVAMNAL